MTNIDSIFQQGQDNFYDTIKLALFNLNENIFEDLNFDNDFIFSEPLLYSFFIQNEHQMNYQQILFGYFNKDKRPKEITVISNNKGIIFFPNFGYFHTKYTNEKFTLTTENESLILFKAAKIISYKFTPIISLDCSPKLELTSHIDLFSQKYFYDWKGIHQDEIDIVVKKSNIEVEYFKPLIDQAFQILRKHFNKYYLNFIKTTRRIVLFSHPEFRNFATREAHGIIFLNVNKESNVSFFLEEIVHQCSHIYFNAVTYDSEDYFLVPPESKLGDFVGNKDPRTLLGAFHGVYTTGKIVEVFLKLAQIKNEFNQELKFEILGRLALNKKRVGIGLERAPLDKIFTDQGKELFFLLNNQLVENINKNPNFFSFNMTRHPIVFNYNRFKKDNPIDNYNELLN